MMHMATEVRMSNNGTVVRAPLRAGDESILTAAALSFLSKLTRQFGARLDDLLAKRREMQRSYDAGALPHFLPETRSVREGNWQVAAIVPDLSDRRVEITGPVERKMMINALNSGANVFMADFEDSSSPTWHNMLDGQRNVFDAARRNITYHDAKSGKDYRLNDRIATLIIRPRGLHLREKHVWVDGASIPASLFDFGLCFFHNAREFLARGSGPYFYLPKLQSHLEARWWNDVFRFAQELLDLPNGTIRATVLIETLPAAFEMEEILYELREHSAGLNCGRWDYMFSCIKTLRADPAAVFPDRALVTMTQPMMRAYTRWVVRTCHKHGAHAMGGMAAQIPIKNDAAANAQALEKVRADKLREVTEGHDGTWVAHPALVSVAKEIFDAHMPGPNQIARKYDDAKVSEEELLSVPKGECTVRGLRQNIAVGVQYLAAWLSGNGCVPLYHLMEDAATAEISRAQVWQWIYHRVVLDDGQVLTQERFRSILRDEMNKLQDELGVARYAQGRFELAAQLFERFSVTSELADFLTITAYEYL